MSIRTNLLLCLALLLVTASAGCVSGEKRVFAQQLLSDEQGTKTSIIENKLREYEKLAKQFPKEAKFQERLATLYWVAEDHENALRHLQVARELNPSEAKYELMEARIHYSIKNYTYAEEKYKSLVERLGDKYDGPIYELAWLYLIEERYDLAKQQFERCLEINPKLAGAHYGLGDIMLRRNETDKAVAHFESYLRLGGGVHHDDVLQTLRRLQPALYKYTPK